MLNWRDAAIGSLLALSLAVATYQGSKLIGVGIPSSWVTHPMAITGFPLPHGQIDWTWAGYRMHVHMTGRPPVKVKLGSAFPATAEIRVMIGHTR